jgi:hypothetical protein
MKRASKNAALLGISWLMAIVGCAATRLNDVGDINSVGGADDEKGGNDAVGPVVSLGGEGGGGTADPVVTPGGKGGGGGVGPVDPVVTPGGEGGGGSSPEPLCVGCTTVAEDQGRIDDLEVDDEKVFWIDHGSYDKLNNYKNNGRLVARALAGGELEILSDELPGPYALELSGDYAYMAVEELPGVNPSGVVRLPLAGGELETVATFPIGEAPTITTATGFGYFWTGDAVYRIAESKGAVPELLNDGFAGYAGYGLLADSEHVYLFLGYASVDVMPAAGGSPSLFQMGGGLLFPISIDDQYLYALEQSRTPLHDASCYLVRIRKSDAQLKRLAELDNATDFALRADSFFATSAEGIYQGSLAAPDELKLLVGLEPDWYSHIAPSSVGLFVAANGTVRLAPYLD